MITAGGSGVELQFRSISDPPSVQALISREIDTWHRGSADGATNTDDVLDVLTTRVIWPSGVLGRLVRLVELSQVQNTSYTQSVTGSAFVYGTVLVEVAGGPDLELRRIDDPQTIRQELTDWTGTDDDELPGTVEQWQAVLSVVRDIKAVTE